SRPMARVRRASRTSTRIRRPPRRWSPAPRPGPALEGQVSPESGCSGTADREPGLPLRACLLRSPLAGSPVRRAVLVVTALLAAAAVATPAAAASATSWRASIVGTTLHGGATTLITSDGTGSIYITLKDV